MTQNPEDLLSDFAGRLDSVPQVKEMVENELDLSRLVKAQKQEEVNLHYQKLVERVKRLKQDYFPLRLLFNRCLIVLSNAKKTREMADIVSLWLSYLKRDSKEYPYAIEAMRRNTSDIAYRFMQGPEQEKGFAGGGFFSSIRTSDDLESHYQYVLLNMEAARWLALEKSYKQMQKDGLIRPQSITFANTVHTLLQGKGEKDPDVWEDAAKVVKDLPDDYVGLGMKYLLLGYLYQRQLAASRDGWGFDRDLADQAHRSYLFAIDAAYGNDRILAAAYQNLAILHTQLRGYTLAAEFYVKREELPFLDKAQQTAHLWLKARVNYLSYRPAEALASIEKALSLQPSPREPFLEKAAFYAANAQAFGKAVTFYQQFFAAKPSANSAGLLLGYGYALRGAKQGDEAEKVLLRAIEQSKGERAAKDPGAPALIYQPEKVRFIALGLLARTEELPSAKRRSYLEQRLGMFGSVRKSAKLYHLQDEALSDQEIKETQDMAWLQADAKELPKALASLQKSVNLTQKHGEEFSFLSSTVLISVKNAMIFSQEQKQGSPELDKAINSLVAASDAEYKKLTNPSALVTQKWAELRLVAASFGLRQDGARSEKFTAAASALMQEEALLNLAKDKPDLHAALKTYQEGLQKSL